MITFYYFLFIAAGFFFAYLYGKKTKRFLWREYIALLAAPLLGIIGLTLFMGIPPLLVFFTGLVVGPLLEWFVGWLYHRVLGIRLWIYERYPLPGRYTSYLTIPMWGFGIVFLWLIVRNF